MSTPIQDQEVDVLYANRLLWSYITYSIKKCQKVSDIVSSVTDTGTFFLLLN